MAGIDDILAYEKEEEDYYQLLGCDENSSVEQINTEYKIRALQLHPDKNVEDPSIGKKFQLLQLAKETLTNPETRKDYDTWRGSGMAMRFEQWLPMKDKFHTSMHWAVKKKEDLMLSDKSHENQLSAASSGSIGRRHSAAAAPMTGSQGHSSVTWLTNKDNSSGELRQKFRNYEI